MQTGTLSPKIEQKPDHLPDLTKMVKPAEAAEDDHVVDANKMVAGRGALSPDIDDFSVPAPKKQRKEWTPEARAAASERMRARIAARKMKQLQVEPQEEGSDPLL